MFPKKLKPAFACPLHLKLDLAFCEMGYLILATLLSVLGIAVLVA